MEFASKMVESKQVRVDNWGIFFLQRLQVFFSKTDYCDLTLQFEGNVQLKVHRLVMCACTEYFTYLEQSCPALEENTIMMPSDLQADVIVPIVNFMYTGMLEFHMSIFDRLYKAAELMNITVLTKLLDAQKVHPNYKSQKKKQESPHIWNLQGPKVSPKPPKTPELPPPLPGRKLPVWKRKNAPVPMQHPTSTLQHSEQRYPQDPLSLPDSAPKPTRFEWPDDDLPQISLMDTSFEEISYTSKPLLTQEEEIRASTSFDDRKNATTEPNKDDGEFNDHSLQKRKLDQNPEKNSPKRVKLNDKENKEATISIKSSNGADLDHTKIVSEILKKYPQLVKKNKNIRLKIMASGNKNAVEQTIHTPVKPPKMKIQVEAAKAKAVKPVQKPKPEKRPASEEGPWVCNKCDEAGESTQEFVLYYLYRKHMTDMHNETFDTRLCKYCGQWCGKHNLMMYHLYTKHGLKPPTTYNFPKCDQCPYIALSTQKLTQHKLHHDPNEMQCVDCHLAFTSQQTLTSHIQITGHLNRTGNTSFDCQYCTKRLQSAINLFSHIKNSHLKEAKRDGIVILDEIDEVDNDVEEEEVVPPKDKVKIISNVKVPARSEPSNAIRQAAQLDSNSETADTLNNVASGIATSLGLVDIVVLDDNQQYILQQQEDPTGQQEFIIPDLSTGENHFAGQVITTQHSAVLPQGMLQSTGPDISSTDELVMVLTDHDYQDEQEGTTADNSNIVVLYSHPVDGQQGQFITSQGNLLVNSQTGMLEIRNEPITTTAANHMVVNTVDTAESIESIQREIQSHNMKPGPYYEEEKAVTPPIPQTEAEQVVSQPPEEELLQTEEVEPTVAENVEQETTTENPPPEESYQEEEPPTEPIEESECVDKSVEGEKETCEKEEETQESVNPEEESTVKEQSSDNVDAGAAGLEEPMETEEIEQPVVEESHEEKEVINQDPVQESPPEQADVELPPSQETNSVGITEGTDIPPTEKRSWEGESPLDETPENVIFNDPSKVGAVESPRPPSQNTEENIPEAMEVDGEAKDLQQEETEEVATVEEQTNVEPKEKEEMEELPEESDESKETEKIEDISTELSDQPMQEEPSELDYQHHHSETDEDEDENSQSSQDTTQSQEVQKNQESINRAILEDWEDTDSQQSEKQRAAMKQAAENVNKLMDDWEEEDDEEDRKGGD